MGTLYTVRKRKVRMKGEFGPPSEGVAKGPMVPLEPVEPNRVEENP